MYIYIQVFEYDPLSHDFCQGDSDFVLINLAGFHNPNLDYSHFTVRILPIWNRISRRNCKDNVQDWKNALNGQEKRFKIEKTSIL